MLPTLKCHPRTKNSGYSTSCSCTGGEAQHSPCALSHYCTSYSYYCTNIPIQDRGPGQHPQRPSSFLSLSLPLSPRSITSLSPASICISSRLYLTAHTVSLVSLRRSLLFNVSNLFTFALYYPRLETAASTPQVTETPGMHLRSTEDGHRRY